MTNKSYQSIVAAFLILAYAVLASSCTKDYLQKPSIPIPETGEETPTLEASYVSGGVSSANASYWKEADFLFIDSIYDLSTNKLYENDGQLNLTGTYNGTSDYNNGQMAAIILKAAYDDEYLYILAEWDYKSPDAGQEDWLWNGPADPLKSDSTNGWTSQRNDDKIAFAFDINGAMSGTKTFSNSGCAATCHNMGGEFVMGPESGNADIWNWSLSLSEPVGYAFDMIAGADSGAEYDDGNIWYHRNGSDPDDFRTGPDFEWDGITQDISRPLGSLTVLDPAWYLMNKTPFIGDPSIGSNLYKNPSKGCEGCHGVAGIGNGINGDGTPLNNEAFSRTFSRQALKDYAGNTAHEGKSYYDQLNTNQVDNLIAYIRGLAGIPGYYLEDPVPGQSLTDIEVNSNMNLVRINTSDENDTYKVMFKRKLETGNPDDAQFDLSVDNEYEFGVALMDADGKNHIGSLLEYITFKDK